MELTNYRLQPSRARASTLQRVFASGRCFCAETEASAATLMKECSRVCLWHKRLCRPLLPGGCCISGDGEGRCQVDCVLAWWVSSSKLHWEKCRFFPSLLLLVIFCRLCKRNSRNPGFSKETCHSVNVHWTLYTLEAGEALFCWIW